MPIGGNQRVAQRDSTRDVSVRVQLSRYTGRTRVDS